MQAVILQLEEQVQQADYSCSESQQLLEQLQQQLQGSQAEAAAHLALLNASRASNTDLQEAVMTTNAKLADAETRSDSLLSQLTESCLRCSEAESCLAHSESQYSSLQQEFNKHERHLAASQQRVFELEAEVTQLSSALQGVQGELAQAQSAYLQSQGQAEETRQQMAAAEDEAQQRLAAAEEEVSALSASLTDAQARCFELQSQAEALRDALSTATERLAVSKAESLQWSAASEEAQKQLAAVQTEANEAKRQLTAVQSEAEEARMQLTRAQAEATEVQLQLAAAPTEAEEARTQRKMSHSRAESSMQGPAGYGRDDVIPHGTSLQVNPLFGQHDSMSPAYTASVTDSVQIASPVMAEASQSPQTDVMNESQQSEGRGPNPSLAEAAELAQGLRPSLEQQLQQQVGALHSQLQTQSSELKTSEAATEYVQRLLNAVSAENRDLRKQLDKKQILKRSASELQHASAFLLGSAKAKGALAEPPARVSAGLQPASSQIAAMWVTTPSVRRSLMPDYGQSQPYMRPGQALEGAVSLVSPESAEPAIAESALADLDGLQHNSSDRAASNAGAESAGQQNMTHAAVMSGEL